MNLGSAIKGILEGSSGVTDIIGTNKIFPVRIPQGITSPVVKYQIISNDPYDTKSGVSSLDSYRVQISSFSPDNTQADLLDQACRDALDRYAGTANGITVQSIQFLNKVDLYDEDAQEYHKASDYKIRIKI